MQIDIIFGMLLTILRNEKTNAKYLANKYEVSTKTIYRYLTILDTNNIPIISKRGRYGGISISNTIKLNSVYFTASEKFALLSLLYEVKNENLRNSLQTKLLALK